MPGRFQVAMSWNRLKRLLQEMRTTAEAALALLGARLCVRYRLASTAPWAFSAPDHGFPAAPPRLQRRVARALLRAERLLPGTTLCLPQAIAGKWMLGRRGFPARIHLGVGLEPASGSATRRILHAHAWLEAGGPVLTGAGGIQRVTPLPR